MLEAVARRLYLRIWLAVVGGVAVLTLLVGWAWRVAQEYQDKERQAAVAAASLGAEPRQREIELRDAAGRLVLRGTFERQRRADGPPRFVIHGHDGQQYALEMRSPHPVAPPNARTGPHRTGAAAGDFWMRGPFGFVWMLALVGVAVALGVFPIIRKLLKRLEDLQRSVRRFGEGDFKARASEAGRDEVAELAAQFNAAAARIEALVQSHKTLLANASHELRSPLARIRMGLELLSAGVPESAAAQAARGEIVRNLAELDQLVDEILLASRLDAPDADIGSVERVELIALCAEECARLDVDFSLDFDPTPVAAPESALAVEVMGSARLLRRAVRNLLENARRYSTGQVQLTLHSAAPWASVCVQDSGLGVPEHERERIFEKFYRLPGASEQSGGVGLGLALVRSIAQRHGGSVRCHDRADGQRGAAFTLELPLLVAAQQA